MQNNSLLFSELRLRQLSFKNRLFVSPMCQYSSTEGLANSWHLVHLGTRAVGGAAFVMTEAAAVSPEGRISPGDLGIWSSQHAQALKPVTEFIHSQGAISGIQLAHAGRKAATAEPWKGGKPLSSGQGAWSVWGPSAIAFSDSYQIPREMSEKDMQKVLLDFENAARWSLQAGFQVIEVHMAHGYLLNEFLSPLSNQRKDQFGGSLENRMRFPLQVARSLRSLWPKELPVFVRISASDWATGGWTLDDSVIFCRELKQIGIDLIDCSSGGVSSQQKISVGPNYQVPFAKEIRTQVQIPTGAVGMITEVVQVEKILQDQEADVVFMARELLRNPYWPLQAAHKMNVAVPWPPQYERGKFL